MRRVMLILVFGFSTLTVSDSVLAYCSEPSFYATAPSPPGLYSKPSPPYCLNDFRFSGRHTCESWEIDGYINEINNYINDLNSYVGEANDFANAATRFANDAADHARCEAEEAKRELR